MHVSNYNLSDDREYLYNSENCLIDTVEGDSLLWCLSGNFIMTQRIYELTL